MHLTLILRASNLSVGVNLMYYIRTEEVECPSCGEAFKFEWKEWQEISVMLDSQVGSLKCPNCGFKFPSPATEKTTKVELILILLIISVVLGLLGYLLYIIYFSPHIRPI